MDQLNKYEKELSVLSKLLPGMFLRVLGSAQESALVEASEVLGHSLTAEQIRDLLKTLRGNARLPKAAILSAESALNILGIGDVLDPNFYNGYKYIYKGDFFIHVGGSNSYIKNKDWLIAVSEGNILNPINYENSALFRIINLSKLDDVIEETEIDFIAHQSDGTIINRSDQKILSPPGLILDFEPRVKQGPIPIYKWEWLITAQDLNQTIEGSATPEQTVYASFPRYRFDDLEVFNVYLKAYDRDDNLLAEKTVLQYINIYGGSDYYLEVFVKDYNGDPIIGASVSFYSITWITDNDGRVIFLNIPGGTYHLDVVHAGFVSHNESVVLSANIDDKIVTLTLDAEVTNEAAVGGAIVLATILADYDFIPDGYEGDTEIRSWVEDGGTPITPVVLKVRNTDPLYNQHIIPLEAAGKDFAIEIKGYDVQDNHNPTKMLKSLLLNVSGETLAVFMGYRTFAQGNTVTQAIMEAVGSPQHAVVDVSAQADFPDLLKLFLNDVFPSYEGIAFPWFAVPVAINPDNYLMLCKINGDGTLNTSFPYNIANLFNITNMQDSNGNTYKLYYRQSEDYTPLENIAVTINPDFSAF